MTNPQTGASADRAPEEKPFLCPVQVATRFLGTLETGDMGEAARYVADDVVFEGPLSSFTSAEPFLAAMGDFAAAVTKVCVRSVLGDERQAMVVYEMQTALFGTLVAMEHFLIRDGKITNDRLVFDSFPVRAAKSEGLPAHANRRTNGDTRMASQQSQAVSNLYRTWTQTFVENPEWTPPQQAALVESWKVLTAEPEGVGYTNVEVGGIQALWATPQDARDEAALMCIHGGGFVSGSIHTHRKLFAHLAKAIGVRALIIGYTLLPDGGAHPVPLDQTFAAYQWLLEQHIQPSRVALAGDSAGGALAITTQLRARDEGVPLPAAALLLSPWVDFEVTGETMRSNDGRDALFTQPYVRQLADGYRGGTSAKDPLVTPLYADLAGLAPTYIQVGDQELLLDDSRRLAEHAQNAGVEVRLDIFPGMQHTFQMMAGRAPEADDAITRLADWTRPRLGLVDADTSDAE